VGTSSQSRTRRSQSASVKDVRDKFLLGEDFRLVIRRSAASCVRPALTLSVAVSRRSRPVGSSTPVDVDFDSGRPTTHTIRTTALKTQRLP
jgi:hypothetical protein